MILQIPDGMTKFTAMLHRFDGGMKRRDDSVDLGPMEYSIARNLRTRNGTAEPVLKPVVQANPVDSDLLQGIYGFGNYLIAFFDGKAYYRDVSTSDSFTKIADFQMNPSAEDIFAELVPQGSKNYKRLLVDNTKIEGSVNLSGTILPSPAAMVCQDGSNQPWIVLNDATARVTQTLGQWDGNDDEKREYVPVGLQMAYIDGILFILAPSKREIYRSVRNRPLDFAVNIDSTGLIPGNANTTSHAVDSEEVTALNKLNTTPGSLFTSSKKQCYATNYTYDRTVFGEPTFIDAPIMSTGPLNNFSLAEINGSYAFSDTSGLRSFNAVSQAKWEGQNAPFSKDISPIFVGINQTITASVNFDDYAIFAVNSVYGQVLILNDNLTGKFVGLDVYPEISGFIKQFAVVKTSTLERRIFCRTSNNEIWELFAGAVSEAGLYLGDFASGISGIQCRPESLYLLFKDCAGVGNVTILPFVDGKTFPVMTRQNTVVQTLPTPPYAFPFGQQATRSVSPLLFQLDALPKGNQYGFWLTWQFQGSLYSANTWAGKMTSENPKT